MCQVCCWHPCCCLPACAAADVIGASAADLSADIPTFAILAIAGSCDLLVSFLLLKSNMLLMSLLFLPDAPAVADTPSCHCLTLLIAPCHSCRPLCC
jgi:hypothetical protein